MLKHFVLCHITSITDVTRRKTAYKTIVKMVAQYTLEAAFLSFLFSTFDKCLMVLHLIQHAVKAENGYKVSISILTILLARINNRISCRRTGFPHSWLHKFPGLFQHFPRLQKHFSRTMLYASDV